MAKKRIDSADPPAPAAHDQAGPGGARGLRGATLHDVARLAGYSAMTVSRALNTPGSVPMETFERVRDAARRLNYVPNLLAGGLRSRKSRLIAAVIPTLASTVFNEMIQALTATLAERGYQLILGQSGYSAHAESDLLDALIGRRPDGIVLTGVDHLPEVRQKLLTAAIPVVETWDLSSTPIDMLVGFSHAQVGEAVCRHLLDRGHRCLAVLGGDDARAQRRSTRFVESAVAAGLEAPLHITVPAPASVASGRQGFARILAQRPQLDAIFCNSDLSAIGVLTEARVRGIRVPEQLAVIGFGDMAFAADLHPALTTVRIDGLRIGAEAARRVTDQIAGRRAQATVTDVGFEVVVRDSG